MASEDEHSEPHGPPDTPSWRRRPVVDAFVDLVLERGSQPTPEDVAERASVSRATFFRYFATLADLRNEALTRVMERFPELFTLPALGTGSLDRRIEVLVDARVELHEVLHPLELLTRSHAARDADTASFVDATRLVLADQIRRHFDAELGRLTRARRDDMVIAISVVTSVESWEQFRHSHHRSPAQIRRAWRTALAGILAEVPSAPSTSEAEHR